MLLDGLVQVPCIERNSLGGKTWLTISPYRVNTDSLVISRESCYRYVWSEQGRIYFSHRAVGSKLLNWRWRLKAYTR